MESSERDFVKNGAANWFSPEYSRLLSSRKELEKNYSFTDEAPLASLAYYRLKMVDLDGSFTYSTIITVQKDLSVLSVFPNPVSSGENIRIVVEDGAAGELMIQDLNGVEYFRSSFSSADNEMSEVSWNLPSGIYLVLFKGADFFRTSRLVVK